MNTKKVSKKSMPVIKKPEPKSIASSYKKTLEERDKKILDFISENGRLLKENIMGENKIIDLQNNFEAASKSIDNLVLRNVELSRINKQVITENEKLKNHFCYKVSQFFANLLS